MDIVVEYEPNARQCCFHESDATEAVYGGAKGGGKTKGLVMEAAAYALEYPGAEVYLFRETYDDLEANVIKEWKETIPKELYSYHESKHIATMINGTTIKFRYIRNFIDAQGYQGRSMDFIGVDELTKHEEKSIQVLLSCLRSPKGFPPRFRGTCNPGGIGHVWVKGRYIEPTDYGKKKIVDEITLNTIEFIPAKVYDNTVLMENDPAYVRRLENLPETQKKAFLHGDWDIFEGQFFNEFKRELHVIEPFIIPLHWNRYRVFDYGLDMLACYWITIDTHGNAYVYKELHESNLIISDASKRINEINNNDIIKLTYAPPDMWNRRQDTGKSAADLFRENGISVYKSDNNRENGWMSVKEWLRPIDSLDEQTGEAIRISRLKIFSNCVNLIRCLPQLQVDEKNPNDVATEPHEITHAPDALRYFCVMRTRPTDKPKEETDEPTPQDKHKSYVKKITGGKIPKGMTTFKR